jgi:hypothetical protein
LTGNKRKLARLAVAVIGSTQRPEISRRTHNCQFISSRKPNPTLR